ncbi:MAG: tRNA threonylcarbamoyladenosine dehydratase [Mariniphaga sp.]|nr:tRNA threonylcarbamoyladenosine dehydratase [Mariniphaga sp.]MDD4226734.1 tRNA threonylcarbamoyladenosine dehydratase [Mariniphaga sp.]
MYWLERTELLIKPENLDRLKQANVLVVGLGGVGAYAAEMICRAGVGKMTIADGDRIDVTNRNRQLPALISTSGMLKTEIMAHRVRDINPEIVIREVSEFICDEGTVELIESESFDYVIDAIDTLSPKVLLINSCIERGLRVVSSMGAGGRLDPSMVQVSDISETYNCGLARMLRKRLSKLGIRQGVKVVFSSEEISREAIRSETGQNKQSTVGTISYMPAVFGCFVASVVIRDLLK